MRNRNSSQNSRGRRSNNSSENSKRNSGDRKPRGEGSGKGNSFGNRGGKSSGFSKSRSDSSDRGGKSPRPRISSPRSGGSQSSDRKPRFDRDDDQSKFTRKSSTRFSKSGDDAPRSGGRKNFDSGRDSSERKPRFSRDDDKPKFARKSSTRSGGSDERPTSRPSRSGGQGKNFDSGKGGYTKRSDDRSERKPRFSRDDDQSKFTRKSSTRSGGSDERPTSRPTRSGGPRKNFDSGKGSGKRFDDSSERKPRFSRDDEQSKFTRKSSTRHKDSDDQSSDRPTRARKDYDSEKSDSRKKFGGKSDGEYKNTKGKFKAPAPQYDLKAPVQTTQIRLNRYIANSGLCSRREADEYIKMGLISVNGKTITELGYKVNPGDEVRHENRVLRAEKPVYILMNKPKGYLTTTADPEERNTVMHIIGDSVKERIYPVGRLDRNTTGLLLLTNDGDLADKLMHPSYNVKKIYKVQLDRPFTRADFERVLEGVQLEEGRAQVDDVAIVSEDGKTVGIELHIGWNRVVRRIFETLGYVVEKLDRSVYAGLDKKDLPRGHWRFLRKDEIVRLKHFK
jgi:23S rRNA pseudouridine2605 synthase